MKKKLSLLLALSMLLGLTACGDGDTVPETPTAPAAVTGSGTAKGFAGDVTVTLTVQDGKLVEVTAEGAEETPNLGGVAIEKLPAAMKEHNSIQVEAMSGATVTSNAILTAAEAALTSLGLSTDDLTPETVEDVSGTTAEDAHTDVLVIGGGGAGMAATVATREAGKNVVLLEQLSTLGGNTALSGQVFTRSAAEGEENIMSEDELYDYFIMMTKDGDPDVTRAYVENCVDTQQWAFSMGSGVKETTKFHTNPETIMAVQAVGKGALTNVMAEEVMASGADVRLNTCANELIVKDGRVVGAVATNENGQTQSFYASNGVILATGGFPANSELLAKYSSTGAERAGLYCMTGAPSGAGITMGEAVGAAIRFGEDWDSIGTSKVTSGSAPASLLPAMIINDSGERFISENGQLPHIFKEMLHQIAAGSNAFYYVFDSNTVGENGDQFVADGALRADTLEELAEQMKVPVDTFVATAKRYDSMAGTKDEDFGKEPEYMLGLSEGPFYAFPGWPYRTSTIGGLVIDEEAHVLDDNDEVIPGLYAAGELANYSFFHSVYPTCGSAVGHAIIFGRIAGTNAANNK